MGSRCLKQLLFFSLILFTGKAHALEVVQLKLPDSKFVVVTLYFRTGSMEDPYTRKGICSLTADIIGEEANSLLNEMLVKSHSGPLTSDVHVDVDKEVTSFSITLPVEKLEMLYPVFRTQIISPLLTPSTFLRLKEKQITYLDYLAEGAAESSLSGKLLESFLYSGTGYEHLYIGTKSGVEAISLQEVGNFYSSHFGAANLTIALAGNYSGDFLRQVVADFADFNSSVMPAVKPDFISSKPIGYSVKIIAKDSAASTSVSMGFPLDIHASDKDYAALMIANCWLGCGADSSELLNQRFNSQRWFNDGTFSSINYASSTFSCELPLLNTPQNKNYFSINIPGIGTARVLKSKNPVLKEVELGNTHFAIRLAIVTLSDFIRSGLTQSEFDLIRMKLVSRLNQDDFSPEQKLGFLFNNKFYEREDIIAEVRTNIEKLTLAEVNDVLQKYLQVNNVCIVIVTDRSEAIPLARSLRDNLPSPMHYDASLQSDIKASILEEDQRIEMFPMKNVSIELIEAKEILQ